MFAITRILIKDQNEKTHIVDCEEIQGKSMFLGFEDFFKIVGNEKKIYVKDGIKIKIIDTNDIVMFVTDED